MWRPGKSFNKDKAWTVFSSQYSFCWWLLFLKWMVKFILNTNRLGQWPLDPNIGFVLHAFGRWGREIQAWWKNIKYIGWMYHKVMYLGFGGFLMLISWNLSKMIHRFRWKLQAFENMTVLGDSLQHENYFSQTRIAFLRREILLKKYTGNIAKSRKTRNTTEKSNSRSHRQRMCISLVILLRELLPTETRFV